MFAGFEMALISVIVRIFFYDFGKIVYTYCVCIFKLFVLQFWLLFSYIFKTTTPYFFFQGSKISTRESKLQRRPTKMQQR